MNDPQYVILRDASGKEVSRHRTDRMNYAAFTWVFALEEEKHGPLTADLEPVKQS